MTTLDKKIIRRLSRDIPLSKRPFEDLAAELCIKEIDLLTRLKNYKKLGLLRKFTAVLNHRKTGYNYNAMAVWNVPVEKSVKTGILMASFPEVTHCYQRKKPKDWNYNLYTMIHGKTKKECLSVVERISKKTGIKDYRVLFSTKEYKKTGVKY